jgi:hypothetical protein
MCEILGLTEEETHVDEAQMNEQGVGTEQGVDIEQCVDTEGVAIPTSDVVPSAQLHMTLCGEVKKELLLRFMANGKRVLS